MAAIAATDVSIALLPTRSSTSLGSVHPGVITNKQRRTLCRLSISATAGLTYPSSGGISLPAFGAATGPGDNSYGMVRNLSHIIMVDAPMKPSTGGIVWRYDQANHAIRGFWNSYPTALAGANPNPTSFPELPTTFKPSFAHASGSSLDFIVEVVGW